MTEAPRALIVLPAQGELDGASVVRVWGLDALQRLERGLPRVGVSSVEALPADQPAPQGRSGRWIVVRADLFYDERLLTGLAESPDVLLIDSLPDSDAREAMAAHVSGDDLAVAIEALRKRAAETPGRLEGTKTVEKLDLAPAYNATLRKYDPPFVFRAEPGSIRKTENHIFKASYKGITDLVTKWVWPLPAREVVRVLARQGVKPNSVTAVGYALTILTAWLFYEGWFATGLVLGWLMTFLDTVDGKLARCTLTSSKIGGALDHGLDLVHPPIWWAAWAYGLPQQGSLGGFEIATGIVVGGYVTGRLLEGVFLLFFDQELFTWRPFDAFFRTIIARRNPNLIILSVGLFLGRPEAAFYALASWTIVANLVPGIRIVQAFALKRSGGEIRSWYEEKEAAKGSSAPA